MFKLLKNNKVRLYITVSILFFLFGINTKATAQINDKLLGANEKVYLHLPKNYYLAGEILPYTAYMFSSENANHLAKSKILYYTLRHTQNFSTISWWNRMSDKQLASAIVLPDTLSSGIYELYAYTNAMRNLSTDFVNKTSLFISRLNEKEQDFYQIPVDSFALKVRLQPHGKKLIAQRRNALAWFVPPWFRKTDSMSIYLIENNKDTIDVYSGRFTNTGVFYLTPEKNKSYTAIVKLQTKEYRIPLPEVQQYGYIMHTTFDQANNLSVNIYANESGEMRQNGLQLRFCSQGESFSSKDIALRNDSATLFFEASEIPSGMMNLQLQSNNKILINKLLVNPRNIKKSHNSIACKFLQNEIYPRDSIHIFCSLNDLAATDTARLSVSVSQKMPQNMLSVQNIVQYATLRSEIGSSLANSFSYNAINNLLTIVPFKNYKWQNLQDETTQNCYFPAEQNGYLLTGRIQKKYGFTLPQNNKVLLAIHDSLSYLDYSTINPTGDFAFLLNSKYNNQKLMLSLYNKDTSELVWYTDDKRLLNSNITTQQIVASAQMQQFIKEYKKRYLITNVFTPQKTEPLYDYSYTPKSDASKFIFTPELIIYPDNYVYLNSFEEIVENIVPGVKFVEKRNAYKICVINQHTQKYRKYPPLVLLNGIPCTNYAYINSLNSETIKSIAINRQCVCYGDATFYGIIAVRTGKKLFSNNILDDYFIIHHNKNQIAGEKTSIAITRNMAKNTKTPLLSPLLYWKPNIMLTGSNTLDLQFFVSDLPGEYELLIQGVVNDNPVYLKKIFTIQPNQKLCNQ